MRNAIMGGVEGISPTIERSAEEKERGRVGDDRINGFKLSMMTYFTAAITPHVFACLYGGIAGSTIGI